MTKFFAKCFVTVGMMLASLGQYWFTFGLWPRSWWSFFGWAALSIVLMGISMVIDKENE